MPDGNAGRKAGSIPTSHREAIAAKPQEVLPSGISMAIFDLMRRYAPDCGLAAAVRQDKETER